MRSAVSLHGLESISALVTAFGTMASPNAVRSKLEQREAELAKLRETMDKALKDEKSKRSALEKGQEKVAAVGEKEAFLAESLQKATEELEELRADKERWDQLSATESGMLKEKDEELKARFQQEIVELKAAKEAAFKELEQAKSGTHHRQKIEEKRLSALKADRIRHAEHVRKLALESIDKQYEEVRREAEEEKCPHVSARVVQPTACSTE